MTLPHLSATRLFKKGHNSVTADILFSARRLQVATFLVRLRFYKDTGLDFMSILERLVQAATVDCNDAQPFTEE